MTTICLDLGVKVYCLLDNNVANLEWALEQSSEKEEKEKEEVTPTWERYASTSSSSYSTQHSALLISSMDFPIKQYFAEIPVPPPDYLS